MANTNSEPGDVSGEAALIQVRGEKAERLRQRGVSPYPNQLAKQRTLIRELREQCAPALVGPAHEFRYDPDKVAAISGSARRTLCGRIMARRGFGKASFLPLRDASGELQLFAKQDEMGEAFGILEDLDI